MRLDRESYFLGIAEAVSKRSTCIRRNYGAVVINDDIVVSTGYNGTSQGRDNCCDTGICNREKLKVPPGERYELCVGIHAEQNALLFASRKDVAGGTIYVFGRNYDGSLASGEPCLLCIKFIENMGIKEIVYKEADGTVVRKTVAIY